jgi:hypothetical protein
VSHRSVLNTYIRKCTRLYIFGTRERTHSHVVGGAIVIVRVASIHTLPLLAVFVCVISRSLWANSAVLSSWVVWYNDVFKRAPTRCGDAPIEAFACAASTRATACVCMHDCVEQRDLRTVVYTRVVTRMSVVLLVRHRELHGTCDRYANER